MTRDPQVDLIFSHFIPRYEATGVDPNDLRALIPRITQWSDWCALWSAEAARHEKLADEALAAGLRLTAAEAYVRAAIYYHYGKHLFADRPDEFRRAHDAMLRCYSAAAPMLDPPVERVEFPYQGTVMAGWLRKPRAAAGSKSIPAVIPGRAHQRVYARLRRAMGANPESSSGESPSLSGFRAPALRAGPGMTAESFRQHARPPVAVILPGLDACKEELHAWAEAFVARGLAALTLDGPGQGETSFRLPVTHEWGRVIGAVIDVLEKRDDVDGHRVGVVGQSLGALYALLAASGEPRLKACIANCGPFDWGTVLPKMPKVSQEVFRVRSHSKTIEEAHSRGKRLTLEGRPQNIKCPLLVVFGAGDRLISPAEGERLAKTASGPAELVVYPEGNHVCFNISYKFRPLTADWMAKILGA